MTKPMDEMTDPRTVLWDRLKSSITLITGDLFQPLVTDAMADAMVVVVTRWLSDVHEYVDGVDDLLEKLDPEGS